MLPLSLALAAPPRTRRRAVRTCPRAERDAGAGEALGHRSFVLLVIGYFTCGFQLFFITVHLPAYLVDRGLPASIGGWTIAVIGLFNIFGSIALGLSLQPDAEAVHLVGDLFQPLAGDPRLHPAAADPAVTLIFGAVMGLLWLSTIPPTSALVAMMFGNRWLTMLLGSPSSAIRSAASSASGSAACCSSGPAPMT